MGQPEGQAEDRAEGPAEVLDLRDWYLTLPTGAEGSPDTVEQPALRRFSNEFFKVSTDGGVEFTAPAGGVTTKNSEHPRAELREMQGSQKAAWSNATGTHTMRIRQAITETPEQVPDVVAGQIHATTDDLMQIRLEGPRLVVKYADGEKEQLLDPDYRLGTAFDVDITATNGTVQVTYNGAKQEPLKIGGTTLYFKAGAYTQSNPEKGDQASAAGQVIIYKLEVQHSDTGAAAASSGGRDDESGDRARERNPSDDDPSETRTEGPRQRTTAPDEKGGVTPTTYRIGHGGHANPPARAQLWVG
jgi:Alginate lyase